MSVSRLPTTPTIGSLRYRNYSLNQKWKKEIFAAYSNVIPSVVNTKVTFFIPFFSLLGVLRVNKCAAVVEYKKGAEAVCEASLRSKSNTYVFVKKKNSATTCGIVVLCEYMFCL